VIKRKDSVYSGLSSRDWLKVRTSAGKRTLGGPQFLGPPFFVSDRNRLRNVDNLTRSRFVADAV
jgi:hypothetical protein